MWICVKLIYFCDQSWIFSIITAVFSVTWSSEIIIICWFAALLISITVGAQLLIKVLINVFFSWFLIFEQQIRMISEGSRDTEDCSNDAENTALITEINYSLT